MLPATRRARGLTDVLDLQVDELFRLVLQRVASVLEGDGRQHPAVERAVDDVHDDALLARRVRQDDDVVVGAGVVRRRRAVGEALRRRVAQVDQQRRVDERDAVAALLVPTHDRDVVGRPQVVALRSTNRRPIGVATAITGKNWCRFSQPIIGSARWSTA